MPKLLSQGDLMRTWKPDKLGFLIPRDEEWEDNDLLEPELEQMLEDLFKNGD